MSDKSKGSSFSLSSSLLQRGEFLVYEAEDGRVKLEVRLQDESVWLTQQHMAELFQTTKQNISLHLQNIFAEGELTPEATVKKYLTVRQEGGRQVQRELEYHNLDAIISVGYRVKSHVAKAYRSTPSCCPLTMNRPSTFQPEKRRRASPLSTPNSAWCKKGR